MSFLSKEMETSQMETNEKIQETSVWMDGISQSNFATCLWLFSLTKNLYFSMDATDIKESPISEQVSRPDVFPAGQVRCDWYFTSCLYRVCESKHLFCRNKEKFAAKFSVSNYPFKSLICSVLFIRLLQQVFPRQRILPVSLVKGVIQRNGQSGVGRSSRSQKEPDRVKVTNLRPVWSKDLSKAHYTTVAFFHCSGCQFYLCDLSNFLVYFFAGRVHANMCSRHPQHSL